MDIVLDLLKLAIFPGGACVLIAGLFYEWADRKLVAQLQNRIGPRWFQPFADVIKLLAKEEVVPTGAVPYLFMFLPVLALGAALTAAVAVPMFGVLPLVSYPGDLVVTVYLLSVVTMSLALAGSNTNDRFSLIGATRTLTQLFSYEAPFLLALLGPAILAGSWQISQIAAHSEQHWWWTVMPLQLIGFIVAIIGLMGKVEMPPFDAPEAETEIVAGALTEYSGRGWALFRLAKAAELLIGLTLIAALYLGGVSNPLFFLLKTLGLLVIVVALQTLVTRFRIEQTVRYWRFGSLLVLMQWLVLVIMKGMGVAL